MSNKKRYSNPMNKEKEQLEISFLGFKLKAVNPTSKTLIIVIMLLIFFVVLVAL